MTRRQSWEAHWPPLRKGGNWNSARVTCLKSYMYKWLTYDRNLDLLTQKLLVFPLQPMFLYLFCIQQTLVKVQGYIGYFYFIWAEFTDYTEISVIMDPASKPYVFSVRIMSQGPKLLSSIPRLRERGCLMSSSQKRTQSLKLLPSEGIMNTPRTEWLHFSSQQKCESAKEQAQYMEEVLAGVKAYPELNPLGIRACWWSNSGSGERLPAGRRLRERANTLSIWLRYDTSQKLYPESKDYPHNSAVSGNITAWLKQVPCLHLANSSTKVAKAGYSTVYMVTFRATIWHSLK